MKAAYMNENWQYITLGDAITLKRGYDLPTSLRDAEGTIPVVSSAGITGRHWEAKAYPPGIVTGRYGTTGQIFYLTEPFWPLNTTLYVVDFKGNLPIFIYFLLQTIDFDKYSGKTGVPGVNRNELHKIPICLPPLEEQQKIAAILSTWDEAIGLVEQLIAALGRRKQALMQLLLTGAVRFAGFEGEWEEVELGEIFTLRSGKTKPDDTDAFASLERCIPIYGGNGILGYTGNVLEEGERIIIGRVGEYCGVVHYINESCWITDNALYTTNFLRETSVLYLAYLLEYLDLGKLRSKGGQPLVSQKPIYGLTTQIPNFSEQSKIAEVIRIVDEELGLINNWNEHLQEQKRGLMQQLLTGAVRV